MNVSDLFGTACPDINDAVAPCSHYVKGGFCTLPVHFRCVEYVIHHEPPLSYSAISDYSHCHRKFYHGWLQGYELIEKGWALKKGALAAEILGVLHHKDRADDCVQWYKTRIDEEIRKTIDPEDEALLYGRPDLWAMKAMFDVYIELEFHTMKGVTEYEFRWDQPEYPKVHGFVDLVDLTTYDDTQGYEFKYTGNSDNYEKWLVDEQLSAYFIGVPQLKRMTVRCFVPPLYKLSKKESIMDYYDRMAKDIRRRSITEYFISRTYWRNEFDLEAYKQKARMIAHEIVEYLKTGSIEPFYCNKKACLSPFPCDFLQSCRYGVFSDQIYRKRGHVVKHHGRRTI